MELSAALRSTGAVRAFTDEPVADAAVWRVLDTARFAPSGGNGQGWRVVVVKDHATRTALRDLYLAGWYDYLAMSTAMLRPWAPGNDPEAERRAMAGAATIRERAAAAPGFAETLDTVPVLLAVLVDLRVLAAVDRDAERYSFAGGASVYPFCWSVLLAAREEGLGGVITTMCIREERAVKDLLHAGEHDALAAVIALGHPVRQVERLRRRPVADFATVDTVDGTPFSPDPS